MQITSNTRKPDLLVLIGHTAAGKTTLAAHLAHRLNGEVISADSRQVYRGMDIGTGKDLSDYQIDNVKIPYHLIDLVDAGEKYTLFDFKRDFQHTVADLINRGKTPILCGGTGLYVEAILKGYDLPEAPIDDEFRHQIEMVPDEQLIELLKSYGPLHNITDITERERLVRAIEIARSNQQKIQEPISLLPLNSKVFAISFETEHRRQRITARLTERLANGMVDEVKSLLLTVKPENLMYYGLEYKYLTRYCLGEMSYEEMFSQLNIAIHQFAKRQMTWFRGMERRGIEINWIPGEMDLEDKIRFVLERW